MNSQCQNDEIKLLIFLFCLSVVSLLSIAVQWNSVVSTWRFSFILMQRSRDDGVSGLRFAGRWHFLCYDLHVLKVDHYHVEQPLKQFWSCLNDWNLFSIVGHWLLKNVIYYLWKSASPEAFYSPLFAVVHYFFNRVYIYLKRKCVTGNWFWKQFTVCEQHKRFWISTSELLSKFYLCKKRGIKANKSVELHELYFLTKYYRNSNDVSTHAWSWSRSVDMTL